MSRLRTVRAACPHDCPDTCSMIVTVDDDTGRAVKLRGDPDHHTTRGFLCAKVNRYLDRTYSPDRVLHPHKRIGPKGAGEFARISWDDALDLIADRLGAIAARDPQGILPYSYGGTLGLVQNGSMDHRFFHRLGASFLDRTICASAGTAALESTLGWRVGPDIEAFRHARLILIWGSNVLTSNVHLWPFILEAKAKNQAQVIVIDPIRTRTAERADLHLAIKPGTDAALALGMMHVIFEEGLADREYLAEHTLGHQALERRAREEWPLARAAEVTGLAPEVIASLARAYATTHPAAIRVNYGLQRHKGGGTSVRAIVALPAVTGAWRHPGGGAMLSTSGAYPVDKQALARPDLIPPRKDGLPPRTINMSRLGDALDPAITFDPPVEALVVYTSNPAAVAPDQERVLAGLRREDLFTVVHEIFMTDTARYADVLLPATTQLEQRDIHKSYGHLDVLLSQPAIAPLGEAVPDTELFRRLAKRMGFTEPCFEDDDETICRQAFSWEHPRMAGITYDRLAAEGPLRLSVPDPFVPFAEGRFQDREGGKCLLENPALAELGLDPLVGYLAPAEDAPGVRYPLMMLSPPAHHFLNTSFANLPFALRAELEPTLEIHPEDALSRGIASGQRLVIENELGAFEARADVTDRVRPGVVSAPSIWWLSKTPTGRNANAVTSQRLTDMGGGATFYDTRVEVRARAPEPAPLAGDPSSAG